MGGAGGGGAGLRGGALVPGGGEAGRREAPGHLSGLPPAPQPPGLAPALSRLSAWPTPSLPRQAVRRAPGRPPEQP